MRTMKIWRKSRLSECHANLFANGRVRAIYVNIFVMCGHALPCLLQQRKQKMGLGPDGLKAEVPVQTTDKVYNVSEDGETIVFHVLTTPDLGFPAEVDGEPILPPYMDEIGYGLIYGENFRAEDTAINCP